MQLLVATLPTWRGGHMIDTQTGTASQTEANADDLQTLNFKVSRSFKKAFKIYAVEHGISMVDLLREGFELSKKQRKS